MNSYDNGRIYSQLTAYKPRPWGEEAGMNIPVYSKPEPTSKTNIPSVSSLSQRTLTPNRSSQ